MLESLWKAHGWGYEEAHLFMAQSQTTKIKGGSRRDWSMSWLCLVHTFPLHKTLNDALKNHETRNIEDQSIMLWHTNESGSYLHEWLHHFQRGMQIPARQQQDPAAPQGRIATDENAEEVQSHLRKGFLATDRIMNQRKRM